MRDMMLNKFYCGVKGVQPLIEVKSYLFHVYGLLRYGISDFLVHFENVEGES